MFEFNKVSFFYEPFPIGAANDVLPQEFYHQLVQAWPPSDLFVFMDNLGKKYALSEVSNGRGFHDFIRACKPWRTFYEEIKSPEFIRKVLKMLLAHHIDPGLEQRRIRQINRLGLWGDLRWKFHEKVPALRDRAAPLHARFEFSMLPADGGNIRPHTDAIHKHITLVLSMAQEGEWNPSFGGGTDVLKPRDIHLNYNYLNRQMGFDQVETIRTFPFEPRQAVIFVKTFNSLHAVQPMKGRGSPAMRKTLTINIEEQSRHRGLY
jgi:hypothetical protein